MGEFNATELIQNMVGAEATATVPAKNLIFMGLAMIIAIGVGVAAIIYLRNHVKDWTYSLLIGFVAFLAIGYFGTILVGSLLNMIPAVAEYAYEHDMRAQFVYQLIEILFQATGIGVGIWYLFRSRKKRGEVVSLGDILTFAFTAYVAAILVEPVISVSFNYIMGGIQLNQIGFTGYVTAIYEANIAEGATLKEAEDLIHNGIISARQLILFDTSSILVASVLNVLKTVCIGITCVIFYGVVQKKADNDHYAMVELLPKRYLILAAAILCLEHVPYILALILHDTWYNQYYQLLMQFVVTLAAGFVAYKLLSGPMVNELGSLRYDRKKARAEELKKANKMPTIIMPKD